MREKRKFLCMAAIFGVICLIVGAFGAAFVYAAKNANKAIINEYYEYGSEFVVPVHTISETPDAETLFEVTYPDGTKTKQSKFVLNQTGKYGLRYYTEVGGRTYDEEFSFKVKIPTVTGLSKSDGYYGTSDKAEDTPGYVVALADGETMTFTQTIDLRGSTKRTFFTDFFPAPATPGNSDCEQFWLTLTDVSDEENYLVVRMNLYAEGTARQSMTLAARGDGQPNVVGQEKPGYIHVGNQYGTYPAIEMNGMAEGVYDRKGEINSLRLSYDESTKQVWACNKWDSYALIADLDDPAFVGESLWKGFASGKVRMSFYASGYMSERANFVFKNIYGANLSDGGIDDVTPPVINVTGSIADAAIGGRYPVPAYSVSDDLSSVVATDVKVLFNGADVAINENRFNVSAAGDYEIVYSARDAFGNEAKKNVIVTANTATAVTVADVSLKDEYNRGEKTLLPEAETFGGRGDVSSKVYAIYGTEKTELNDNVFVPMNAGNYTIIYEATDAVGQKAEKRYNVSVINGSQPVFRDEPDLPDYFIATFGYRAPEFYAYDYSSGTEKKIVATLTVTGPYGSQDVKQNGSFTPTIKNNLEETVLTWKAGETEFSRKVKTIFAISGNGILTENYFVGTASVSKNDGYMEIGATAEGSEWTFVNPLIAEGFTLEMTALPDRSDFDAIELILTDSVDASVRVKAVVSPAGEYRSILTVGQRYALLANGFDKYSYSDKFVFTYNDRVLSVGAAQLKVDKTESGDDFTGFPSGKVRLSMRIVNAAGKAKYRVSNICGQPLGVLASDRVRPQIRLLGDYGGVKEKGSVVAVPEMIACDVLNPSVVAYVSVMDTDGKYVTASDGTVLNKAATTRRYEFTALEYGQYQFEYVAKDSLSGRETKLPFVVNVLDSVKPSVRFKTAPTESAKIGDVIVVPDLTVDDNVSSADDMIINRCIVSPTGQVFHLPEGSNSMKTMYAGIYKVRVLVYDEAGNVTTIGYNVVVTE